jgi:hypothetical protein
MSSISWQRQIYFSPFKLSEPLLDKRTIPLCESHQPRALPDVVLRHLHERRGADAGQRSRRSRS